MGNGLRPEVIMITCYIGIKLKLQAASYAFYGVHVGALITGMLVILKILQCVHVTIYKHSTKA